LRSIKTVTPTLPPLAASITIFGHSAKMGLLTISATFRNQTSHLFTRLSDVVNDLPSGLKTSTILAFRTSLNAATSPVVLHSKRKWLPESALGLNLFLAGSGEHL